MRYSDTFPRRAAAEVFWRQLDPVEHAVQIYEDQTLLMDALEGFASGGLRAGEAVIVIASEPHRRALAQRLARRGFDLEQARAADQFLPLDAASTLDHFMRAGRPDEARFHDLAQRLVARARGTAAAPRRVRAFGEMVALLWDQGNRPAALALERLWDVHCQQAGLALFCAYPRQALAGSAVAEAEICAHHTRVCPI